LEVAVWRVLLNVSIADIPLNGITGIGDSGFERAHVSTHDKHREFTFLHKAWNARLDNDLYYRRNMNWIVKAAFKQKFGAFVRSRLWWKQFRELVIKCIVHNLERSLAISHEGGESL